MSTSRTLRSALTVVALSGGLVLGLAPAASAVPPNIPDTETAQTMLTELEVAPDGSMDGYDRDEFPHWSTVSDNCNTREEVLKRDGEGVEVGEDCYPTSGSWFSPFDGETRSEPSDISIDHMVPLANAWRTGAAEWTRDKREQFANDLDDPQLIAVTPESNGAKGDSSPDEWKPEVREHWCDYGKSWIAVKDKWQLTVNEAEKGALEEMLGTC
ncbi:uncharacterized protein DUF1524 [Tamaricihabitans halophyticus]|uniref:Uncharacterized protein DUF1524 n=1 Tax=Tamaricihabitans halophyticus TaxID=1262583 RepID=A0A4R2QVP8_9PSEU|nr:HNH endonuclease family protein [Tamaricihabitans halophyticus]TCP54152.1 uncharacterized protein DUF1524 [Tamaricihabitans halophyticus]